VEGGDGLDEGFAQRLKAAQARNCENEEVARHKDLDKAAEPRKKQREVGKWQPER
jgi:hypothetical protein